MPVRPPTPLSSRRLRHGDEGSVLAMVPAGFLVLILLATLAVDSAVAYLGQHQLRDSLASAANDAVSAAVSNQAFYHGHGVTLNPDLAAAAACRSLAAQQDGDLRHLHVSMALVGTTIELRATAVIDQVFGRAIPGFGHTMVRAGAGADLQGGPGRSPPVSSPSFQTIAC